MFYYFYLPWLYKSTIFVFLLQWLIIKKSFRFLNPTDTIRNHSKILQWFHWNRYFGLHAIFAHSINMIILFVCNMFNTWDRLITHQQVSGGSSKSKQASQSLCNKGSFFFYLFVIWLVHVRTYNIPHELAPLSSDQPGINSAWKHKAGR